MKRIKWYIGLDNYTNKSPDERSQIWYTTNRELVEAYGGFTRTHVEGGWMDPQSKRIFLESAVIFEVVTENNLVDATESAEQRARRFKLRFEQESVLFTVEALDYAKFVV